MKRNLKFSILLIALLILVMGLAACGNNTEHGGSLPISGQTLSYSSFDVEGYLNESTLTIDKDNNFKYESYNSLGYEKDGMIITGKAMSTDAFLDYKSSHSPDSDPLLAELNKYGLDQSHIKKMWKDRIWLVIETSIYNEYLFGLLNHTEDFSDNFVVGEAFFYVDKVEDNFYFFHNSPLFLSGNKGSKHKIVTIFGNSHFGGYGVDIIHDISSENMDLDFSIVYGDGSTKNLDLELTVDDINGLDTSTTGFQNVSIRYENKEYPLTALVIDSDKIDLENNAYIRLFLESNRVAKGTTLANIRENENNTLGYSSGEVYENIPLSNDEIKITGFNDTKMGKQKLTIKYKGETVMTYITVYDPDNPKIEDVDIDYQPFVKKGSDMEILGANISYDDGKYEYVGFENNNITYTGFKTNSLGAQMVSFAFKGQTIKHPIWVYEEGKEPLTGIMVVNEDGEAITDLLSTSDSLDVTGLSLQLYDMDEEELGSPIAIKADMIEYAVNYNDDKIAVVKYKKDGFTFTTTITMITDN